MLGTTLKSKIVKLSAASCLLIATVWFSTAQAQAQGGPFAVPLSPPNAAAPQLEPNDLTATGAPNPPPPGDGPAPMPVTPGDQGNIPRVPTGQADNTSGNIFPSGIGRDRTIVRVYRMPNNAAGGNAGGIAQPGQTRGLRMVQTIRPDQLPAQAIGQINGVLGINMMDGSQTIDVVANDAQIYWLNQILAPYPQTVFNNGRQVIMNDTPGPGYPKPGEAGSYTFQGPLPTVRTFSRYLVILGVVVATILMSLAAYSMVLGHPYGGARVIGTAAGFMLLLMSYTIWKIVQVNTFRGMSNPPAINQNRPQTAQQSDANMQNSNVPVVPGAGGGRPGRSGIPVQPLNLTR